MTDLRQAEPAPIYYMRDNHTFKELSADVSTALIEIETEFNAGYTYGSLCSKREGFPKVHASGSEHRLVFFWECKTVLEKWADTPTQQQPEPVAEKFEAMHANGNIWITTIAAAAVVRNTTPPKQQAEPWCMKANGCKTKCGNCPNFPSAQQQAEPVAWAVQACSKMWRGEFAEIDSKAEAKRIGGTCVAYPLYTAPPQRQWVGLTDEEVKFIWKDVIGWGDPSHDDEDLVRAIEAKLKERNHDR